LPLFARYPGNNKIYPISRPGKKNPETRAWSLVGVFYKINIFKIFKELNLL